MEWLAQVGEQYGLFVALVCYVIWDSRERERRYINTIDSLSQNLNVVDKIQTDIDEIKTDIKEIARG